MYNEKETKPLAVIVLLTIFFSYIALENFSYEISNRESTLGHITRHISEHGFFENSMLGTQTQRSPFFSWLSLFLSGGQIHHFSLRLVSVCALIGIALISFFSAKRFGGVKSAWPALAFSLTSVAVVNMSTRAEEGLLTAFFMACAWLTWYSISRKSKRWFRAWFWGIFFTSIAASINGPQMYLFFYLPTLFMTRPTDVRKRLVMLPHLSAVSFNILIIIAVQYLLTNLASSRDLAFTFFSTDVNPPQRPDFPFDEGYFKASIKFAFNSLSYYLPWTFIAWTGFCEAYRLVEKTSDAGPEIFRFMRKVTCVLFFAFMFYPETNAYSLLPLIYPLSVMAALHYPIYARRYGKFVNNIVRSLIIINFIALAVIAIFIYPLLNEQHNSYQTLHINSALYLIIAGIIISILCFFKMFKRQALWYKISFTVILIYFSVDSARHMRMDEFKYSKQQTAELIESSINDPSKLVYNFSGQSLRSELFYLKNDSQRVTDPIEAENLEETIYVIGSDSKPVRICTDSVRYKWEAISEPIKVNDEIVTVYKGIVAIATNGESK
ncbi:hypothetical protein LNTAR_05754 [Lentisphaera araneosa HTCC2155]|uniref:Glycosyltransferase RgtA/B/C/D-like domain-containing protein n=1 Tax=Lentisphaera araneosa HTCC2155 TaxID=313628 RepID=A6DPF9_9BACT|nr:hypothetical protein [Lentisphaera araneosa]EDM26455.1 hypothetical protein LNTAR_05754 [Lentisphaera araneosa HTCC2155]